MSELSQLADAERDWNELYLAGDADAFAALLDDSFVYLSERGEFAKAAYIENLRAGRIEMRALEIEDSRTRTFGEVAVVTGVVRMSASFQGQDISGRDRYTRVWRRTSDGWRAVSQHASSIADS